MPTNDFIPSKNHEFNNFQNTFVDFVNLNIAIWDLTDTAIAEWALLTNTPGQKKMRWDDAWQISRAGNSNRSQNIELKAARKAYESGDKTNPEDTSIRLFINRYLRNNVKVTVKQKADMGLTIPDELKVKASEIISSSKMVGSVTVARHLFQRSTITVPGRKSKAKSPGIESLVVFIAFTDAQTHVEPEITKFSFDGTVKRGLYDRTFDPEQEGLRAWYFVRALKKGRVQKYEPPSKMWSAVIM